MTTTTIATTTAPAATTTPVVKITRTTLVSGLYAEARRLILRDLPASVAVGLPRITEAGLERVWAELGSREPRGFAWYTTTVWAWGDDLKKFPVATRRWKLLKAMAGFMPGVPWRMAAGE